MKCKVQEDSIKQHYSQLRALLRIHNRRNRDSEIRYRTPEIYFPSVHIQPSCRIINMSNS
jgi:hypothetical protein